MSRLNHLFIFAGETSGDQLGAKLIAKLLQRFPDVQISAVAGPEMRKHARCTLIEPMESFQVMGFIDVLWHLPRLIYHFFRLRRLLLEKKPDVALFIDYPGFTLRMEAHLKRHHFSGKIIHYICPSVWAWGKKRIAVMENSLDLLISTLPFEKTLFNPKKLSITYIGHPLVHETAQLLDTKADPPYPLLALFPGSRDKEIERNLPLQLAVAKQLKKSIPNLLIALSVASLKQTELLKTWVKAADLENQVEWIPKENKQNLMERAHVAIAKSGTITLELALHQVPSVIIYAVSFLDFLIARYGLKINLPYYSLPNLIAADRIFVELIGPTLTHDTLFFHTYQLLTSEEKRKECRKKCLALYNLLYEKSPEDKAISAIEKLLC